MLRRSPPRRPRLSSKSIFPIRIIPHSPANSPPRVYNQCPTARILAGGYSQGSAVISNAVEQLSDAVKARLDGVVFFGYTKNLQNLGRIPGFPSNKLKVYCNVGDMVCSGTLIITAAHLTYGLKTTEAALWLASKVQL